MSSPIAIPRRAISPAASDRMGSPSSSPSGLYVPLHRRTPSASSSGHSEAGSSRPPSPTVHAPQPEPEAHSGIYSLATLLALETPAFKTSMQERIRDACPEVLITSRTRKNAAFRMRHAKGTVNTPAAPATTTVAPEAPPAPIVAAQPIPTPTPAPAQRTNPRRTRPAGRGPERRRVAMQLGDNWRAVNARPRAVTVSAPVAVL